MTTPLFPKPQRVDRDSPWRNCNRRLKNGSRCNRLFHISRMSTTKCPQCWKELREERRAARGDRRRRAAPYKKPPKAFWSQKRKRERIVEVGARCEVCLTPESTCKILYNKGLTREHLLPVRFIMQHRLGDPHLDLNIKMTCTPCCGRKVTAEAKLFSGDVLGFVTELKKFGWDMEELELVLKHYRFFPQALEHFFKEPE